jgi:hypothetical protein
VTNRVFHLTRREILALGRAFAELGLAAIRVRLWPAQRILSSDIRASSRQATLPADKDLALMAWAISAVARRLPWRADCLVQALAAQHWLKRSGVEAALSVGAGRDAFGAFAAHAWVKVGDTIVAGGDISRYAPFTAAVSPD